MSIKHRLAKLERGSPGAQGRYIVLPLYEGETRADVYAAHPDVEPGGNDLVVFAKRYGPVPEVRARPVITPMVG